jgi:hypothetical protein
MQSSPEQIGPKVTRLAVTQRLPEQTFVELRLTEVTAALGPAALPPAPVELSSVVLASVVGSFSVVEPLSVVGSAVAALESPEETSLSSPPRPVVS